ncbi:DNA repair protein Rad4, putative [Talaromyces stipitatus ATCC 10500]|uniref:DNA repair protein Rad4, putative n=1 Tax=Talaromyces stipitatus (strain ATCC 10500 / CBS 375.48 / QM 6759 / NRRL 1006) TaxID=441959 RepID=B8M065_TALSN|nr:DNA repair protein Rad4, putative [Talaromyces stipitatus ATCC 10500]EED21162.1 DNA repair protein Rad4, putative [Talaromyces stipitatus ATCC 10500]
MPRAPLPRRGRVRPQNAPKNRDEREREEEIPQVYHELLAEADARAAAEPHQERPLKRRRVGERAGNSHHVQTNTVPQVSPNANNVIDLTQTQTIYDLDAEQATEDESDMEWEEVIVQQSSTNIQNMVQARGDESLDITLDEPSNVQRTIVTRRKPVSGAEKKLRLDVHKTHVLCLLAHVSTRNLWCNDDEVQKYLKQTLPKQTISLLNPRESLPQFTRSTTFIDGIKQASEAFARRFKVTAPGLRRPYWAEGAQECKDRAASIMHDGEIISTREEFREQARKLQGSRDFGAQLFCALLRSAAVEARLVCSLQVLPFSGVAKGTSPEKPKREYIVISSDDNLSSSDDKIVAQSAGTPAKGRRLGQPSFKMPVRQSASNYLRHPRNFSGSPFPVFWVEVFNEAVQKWIPVDPLVTKSVARASKFEPPASDRHNNMSYVVAFEEDDSARDVTRRYAKAYNAKTQRTRVESTKDGETWWTNVMNYYEKPFLEDRDQLEFSEFTAKSAAEPMPRNIQDFKGHPVYALERHLRQNEVIHPKRKIGQVEVGKPGSKKGSVVEPVYRRADVHLVRSADGWYRLGRDIKIGEQPLKRVAASQKRNESDDEKDGVYGAERTLYALHQTELYKSPPVVNGKVPKNAYGNLDVYVPTMIPPGGFHLKHPEAARAARILDVDYAPAVTGFEFKGRHGTAVFNGVIAASEYREALEEVVRCIEDERMQEELDRRTEEALRLWKHLLLKLRIAERVKNYAIEGEASEVTDNERHVSDDALDDPDFAEGGGFIPEDDENHPPPTSGHIGYDGDPEDGAGSGFIVDEDMVESREEFTEDKPTQETNAVQEATVPGRKVPTPVKLKKSVPRYKLIVIPNTTSIESPSDPLVNSAQRKPQEDNVAQSDVNMSDVIQGDRSSEAAPIKVDFSSGHPSTPVSVDHNFQGPDDLNSPEKPAEPEQSESDSDLEKVSLLSHDPEDEDAEPDWLMSD